MFIAPISHPKVIILNIHLCVYLRAIDSGEVHYLNRFLCLQRIQIVERTTFLVQLGKVLPDANRQKRDDNLIYYVQYIHFSSLDKCL